MDSLQKIWSQIPIILQSRVYAAEKQFFESQKRAAESKPVGRHSPDPGSGHGEAGTYSTVHPSGREVGQRAPSENPTLKNKSTSKAEY